MNPDPDDELYGVSFIDDDEVIEDDEDVEDKVPEEEVNERPWEQPRKEKKKRGRPKKEKKKESLTQELREEKERLKEEAAMRTDFVKNVQETEQMAHENADKEDNEALIDLMRLATRKIGSIEKLRKRCHAFGTGKTFTISSAGYDLKKMTRLLIDLETELKLINSEINARRSEGTIKAGLVYGTKMMEKIVPYVTDDFDVTGLSLEVEKNFELFEEPCIQLSVEYDDYLMSGPVPAILQSISELAVVVNNKNQAKREQQRQQDAQ